MSSNIKSNSIANQMRGMKQGDTLFFPLKSYTYILNIPNRALRQERFRGVRFEIKAIDAEDKVMVKRIS